MIELNKIKIDGGTQQRAELNQSVVDEYAEAYQSGVKMPPIVVFFDGASYWLADGFHRYFGAKSAGLETILEEVIPGTVRDAILYSLKANDTHGLRRSNADKRKSVMTMLEDAEWSKWSDSQISKACAVSPTTVGTLRASLSNLESDNSGKRTYTTKHGTTATMQTANIGKKKEGPQPIQEPMPWKPANEPEMTADDEVSLLADEVVTLAEENSALKDRLSVAAMDATEEEKASALETITFLRAEVKRLEIENKALTDSRNSYQRECAELKRQCAMQRRQLEKVARAA